MSYRRGGSHAYMMWALGMCGYVFASTCRSSLSATGIQAAHYFNTTSTMLSSFVYVQLFVYAFMQIPAGILLDSFGPRALVVAGCILMSAGQGMLAVTGSVYFAILGRAVVGLGDALIFISVIRLLIGWFPLRRLPVMNQLTGQLGNLGQILSVYPFVWMMDSHGWTYAFLSLSGIGMVIAFCCFLLMTNRPEEHRVWPERHYNASLRNPPSHGAGLRCLSFTKMMQSLRRAFHMPGTVCGFWVHAMTWFSINMLNQLWGFPFLLVAERYTRVQASAYLSFGMLLCVFWALLFGYISGAHPIHGRAAIIYMTVLSQMLLWSILLLTPGPHPKWLLLALLLALSSGTPAASIAFDYVRDANGPSNLGIATGFANIGGFLFTSLALLGVGAVLDALGAKSPRLYTQQTMYTAMLVQYPLWIAGLLGFSFALPGTLHGIRRRFEGIGLGENIP